MKKYCKDCKRITLSELEEEGYLEPRVRYGRYRDTRTKEQKEKVYETKFGKWHG